MSSLDTRTDTEQECLHEHSMGWQVLIRRKCCCINIAWGDDICEGICFCRRYMLRFRVRATRALSAAATPDRGRQAHTKAVLDTALRGYLYLAEKFMMKWWQCPKVHRAISRWNETQWASKKGIINTIVCRFIVLFTCHHSPCAWHHSP